MTASERGLSALLRGRDRMCRGKTPAPRLLPSMSAGPTRGARACALPGTTHLHLCPLPPAHAEPPEDPSGLCVKPAPCPVTAPCAQCNRDENLLPASRHRSREKAAGDQPGRGGGGEAEAAPKGDA